MTTTPRASLVALLCILLSGCALLPAIGANLAAQGATALVALSLGPLDAAKERSNPDRCAVHAANGIAVTESLETAAPASEGAIATFEAASWRPEFAGEGYPQVERFRTPAAGALAVSDRSVRFVALPGAASVRIPYELVQGVEVQRNADTGAPRALIVKSCFGRFDIVSFGERPRAAPDAATTTAAAVELDARIAAFRAAADK
jgi:hypothetical protein